MCIDLYVIPGPFAVQVESHRGRVKMRRRARQFAHSWSTSPYNPSVTLPTVGTVSMALVSDTCRPARLLAVSNAAEFCVNTITVITDCCIRWHPDVWLWHCPTALLLTNYQGWPMYTKRTDKNVKSHRRNFLNKREIHWYSP